MPIEWAVMAVLVAAAAAYTLVFHFSAPYYDMWDLVPMFRASEAGELSARDLFMVHGGHWHASGYAVLIPLAALTHWSHTAEAVAMLLVVATYCWLLAGAGKRFAIQAAPAGRLGLFVLAAAFLCFSLDQATNFVWMFTFTTFMGVFGAVVCLMAFAHRSFGAAHFLLAQVGLAIAVTGHAAGFALLPVGLALIAARDDVALARRVLFSTIWIGVAIAWSVAFLAAQQQHSALNTFTAATDIQRPGFLSYFVQFEMNFIGAAVARPTDALVAPLGVLAPAAAFAGSLFLARRGVSWRVLGVPLALCAFAIGAGLLCGVGRYAFGADQGANGRYVPFSTLFWVGFAWIMLAVAARVESKAWRNGVFSVLALFAALKLVSSVQVAVKNTRSVPPVAAIATQMRADPAHAAAAARGIAFERQWPALAEDVTFIRERRWSVYRD